MRDVIIYSVIILGVLVMLVVGGAFIGYNLPPQAGAPTEPRTEPLPDRHTLPQAEESFPPARPSQVVRETPFVEPSAATIQKTNAAVVNILCVIEQPNRISTVSGSGVVIDPRGVILTNAHVAQYFLFASDPAPFKDVDCEVRSGSPAERLADAELIFLSPSWIEENASMFAIEDARGTGESDIALLRIRSEDEMFPHVSLDVDDADIDVGMPVVVASYPAGFLESARDIVTTLFLFTTRAAVTELFTFDDSATLDLISLEGSFLAQQGSSGGAVVGGDGTLKGIITLSSDEGSFSNRQLRAITTSHVNRHILTETGRPVSKLLQENLSGLASQFEHMYADNLRGALREHL